MDPSAIEPLTSTMLAPATEPDGVSATGAARGAELFSLPNSTLRTLSRLLGPDFRGAIVQISQSGWSHDNTLTTILLDFRRVQSFFRLTQ